MDEPARARRIRTAWLAAALVLVTSSGCDSDSDNTNTAPYVVSYAGAAGQLAALDEFEDTEQLRDWARFGLASQLELGVDRVVDALYDTTPLRDPAFADLVEQPTGPGRSLFDGKTLHVLVPEGDPHRSRSIALVLDEHRADAGTDAATTQVHTYRPRPERELIELVAEPAAPTGEIRTDNGWQEARVDQPGGLDDFLAATDHLSRLEISGDEVRAGGWRWPDTPNARDTAQVTAEDVAVLQRAYQRSGSIPGFSLDPRPLASVEDVRATIPELAPGIADAITTGNWAGTGYTSAGEVVDAVSGTLFQENPPPAGLPSNRTQQWALLNLLDGRPVYSQARFDGDLAGTEVGMTLFYVDLVTKDWITGVGDGVPTRAVPGFVPDPEVPTPPSLCATEPRSESGRLWLGQAETAFTFTPSSVDIGAQATRVFSRADAADGTEVEPSYSFGRGLRWFDQHYQPVADYEIQFHRTEQLMRWAGVLEWLTAESGRSLPVPPDSEIRDDRTFADWYAGHDELRERAELTLVTPPSSTEEAVLPTPSKATPNCGLLRVAGGVSLADGLARGRDRHTGNDALPIGMRRAGPVDPATTKVDTATGSTSFDQVTLGATGQVTDRRGFVVTRGADTASVRTTGSARDSIPFAGTRLRDQTAERSMQTDVRADGPNYTFDTAYEGVHAGSLSVAVPPTSGVPRRTEIRAGPGHLDRIQQVIERIGADPVRGLVDAPGLRYSYQQGGNTVYRFDTGWIEVGTSPSTSKGYVVANVQTPNGVVEVRDVVPTQLSPVDLKAVQVLQEKTVTAGELAGEVPDGAPIYTDIAALTGAEPGAPLPAAIPADARVRFVVVRPTADRDAPGQSSQGNRTWSLADRTRLPRAVPGGDTAGGDTSGDGTPGGGGGASGGGRPLSGWGGVLGWQVVVLVTVCSDASQDEDREPEDCWG